MTKQSDNRNIRVMQFLDAYEKQASLWNPALESYKNKNSRDEAYLQIIKELNTPTLTIRDIKLKVKSIRTTYTKELRMLTKHKDESKPYSPKLFWFNRANAFLKDVSLSRDKRNTAEKQQIHEEEEDDEYKPPACMISYISAPAESRRSIRVVDDIDAEDADIVEETQTQPHHNIHHHQQQHQHPQHQAHQQTNSHQHTLQQQNHQQQQQTNGNYEYKTIRDTELQLPTVHGCVLTTTTTDDVGTCVADDTTVSPIKSKTEITTTHSELHGVLPTTTASATTTLNASSETTEIGQVSHYIDTTHSILGGTGDEYDHFCRSVAAQLRRITDSYSRAVAKLKIQQILFEAETGHYRNNPTITIPISQHIHNL